MVKGYKAMNLDMTCMDYQFEIGKTYEIKNGKPLELCNDSGFHFSLDLEDVFNYYYFRECRLFEVEALGDVVNGYGKSVTNKLRIVRELTQEDLNNYRFEDFCHDLWFKTRTDEELLIYKDDEDFEIREIVVKKLKDLNLMFKTFKDDEDFEVRQAVVSRMEDLDLMFQTFKNDEDFEVRADVVKRMSDLNLMFETFKDDYHPHVRTAVIDHMEDLSLMFNTFKSDSDSLVRMAVIERMEDLDLMLNEFKNDPEWIVRVAVIKNMKDHDRMYEAFKNDEDFVIKRLVKSIMSKLD